MTMTVRITDEYFRYAVRQIKLGRRASMPGIRRCSDCGEHYRSDNTGLTKCPACRTEHSRICVHCGTWFDSDRYGTRLCTSCRNQEALF